MCEIDADHVLDELAEIAFAVPGEEGGLPVKVADKLRALLDRQKKLEREIEALKAKAASGATSDLGGQARDVNGLKVKAIEKTGVTLSFLWKEKQEELTVTLPRE